MSKRALHLDEADAGSCTPSSQPDMSKIQVIKLIPEQPLKDYLEAITLANQTADQYLGSHMLLSWYDRDRDFESPQHASECHQDSSTPGYVDYGINHGATMQLDIETGRFVFFYLQLEF